MVPNRNGHSQKSSPHAWNPTNDGNLTLYICYPATVVKVKKSLICRQSVRPGHQGVAHGCFELFINTLLYKKPPQWDCSCLGMAASHRASGASMSSRFIWRNLNEIKY